MGRVMRSFDPITSFLISVVDIYDDPVCESRKEKMKRACNAPLLSGVSYRRSIESWNGSLYIHLRDTHGTVDLAKFRSGIVIVVNAARTACVHGSATD